MQPATHLYVSGEFRQTSKTPSRCQMHFISCAAEVHISERNENVEPHCAIPSVALVAAELLGAADVHVDKVDEERKKCIAQIRFLCIVESAILCFDHNQARANMRRRVGKVGNWCDERRARRRIDGELVCELLLFV